MRHIHANMVQKGYKGVGVRMNLWGAATSYNIHMHERYMEALKECHHEAYEYLRGIEVNSWARAFFHTRSKCDLIVNNICESFNARILDARDKPIISTMEIIRLKLMKEFHDKRKAIATESGRVCPVIMKKLVEKKNASRHCMPIPAGIGEFEVRHFTKTYKTNIALQE